MKKRLKQAVREHYERERLDDRRLAELQALLSVAPGPARMSRRRLLQGLAAAIILGVGATAFWQWRDEALGDPVLRAAEEIAVNHLQNRPLDVTGAAVSELRPHFARLGFSLIEVGAADRESWRLLGGRYCSVQAVPAAQLWYRAADGQAVTVYQAPYRPERHGVLPDPSRGQQPASVTVRGVSVTLWTERGLLIATATTNAPVAD